MNKLKKNCVLIGAAISLGVNSYGAISVEIQADLLQDLAGNGIPTNALAILVVDTLGNGVARILEGQLVTAKGSIRPGGDDYILGKWDLSVFDTPGVLSVSDVINTDLIPGLDPGDPITLMWFPAMTLNNTTFITGRDYGSYTRATASVDGSEAWTMPGLGGGSRSLGFYTTNGQTLSPPNAVNAPVAGRPSNTVEAVPEPTTFGLLAAGLAGIAVRRRRK